jgi:hypothetical protein
MRDGIGAPNGVGNSPFDRWFRYPAGFSTDVLSLCFREARLRPGSLIVDPFVGVGTAGIYATRNGLPFVGIEAHPLIAELASLKFQRVKSSLRLVEKAIEVVNRSPSASTDLEHPLIQRSFEESVLSRLVGLRETIESLDDDNWRPHLKWCLLGALRDCASVKVGWPYQRPALSRVPRISDPGRAMLRRAHWMTEDLDLVPDPPDASISYGDSRNPETWSLAMNGRQASAVISSPPYLNNFDYSDSTRLELYFWGTARSWLEMTTIVRSKMVVSTTQQSRKGPVQEACSYLSNYCPETFELIVRLSDMLEEERCRRPNGKQYDRMLTLYFADLVQVLVNIRQNTLPESRVVLILGDSAPYGVYVDTPELLASAGVELGFRRVQTQKLRRRGLRWHSNGSKHSVELSEQLVVLESPGPL